MKKKDFFRGASPSLIAKYKRFEKEQNKKKNRRNKMVDRYILERCLDSFID